ncbi:MAG: hypothetical protein GY780_14885 [bacterium]|nr:hypothetical protein [bacterium]
MTRKQSPWSQRLLRYTTAGFGVLCLLFSGSSSFATDLDMLQLPLASPNLCLACHTQESPSPGDAELNPFGIDFLENGRVWDSNLAQLNSDGDSCLNGVEVGDSDGDGQADGNVEEQSGNPGVVDNCGSADLVDEKTWDALKAMFDGN